MTKHQLQAIDKHARRVMSKTLDPQHSYQHVDKVRQNALKIVDILHLQKKIDLHLLQAACLLHDVTFAYHRPGFITWVKEAKYLKNILPDMLAQFHLSVGDRYLLSEAVYKHTFGFPFRLLNQKYSLYSQIVQDADFLEAIAKTRLIDLRENRNLSKFYKVVSLFSGLFIKRIRNKAGKYLNLPNIVEYFREDYV